LGVRKIQQQNIGIECFKSSINAARPITWFLYVKRVCQVLHRIIQSTIYLWTSAVQASVAEDVVEASSAPAARLLLLLDCTYHNDSWCRTYQKSVAGSPRTRYSPVNQIKHYNKASSNVRILRMWHSTMAAPLASEED
jgi:hypothetical protein